MQLSNAVTNLQRSLYFASQLLPPPSPSHSQNINAWPNQLDKTYSAITTVGVHVHVHNNYMYDLVYLLMGYDRGYLRQIRRKLIMKLDSTDCRERI